MASGIHRPNIVRVFPRKKEGRTPDKRELLISHEQIEGLFHLRQTEAAKSLVMNTSHCSFQSDHIDREYR